MNSFVLHPLPPPVDLESQSILRKAVSAHRFLAELKGVSAAIPNQAILINTLSLQEAVDSSAVENIITTQDDLFKEDLFPGLVANPAAKEVASYAAALRKGFGYVQQSKLLTTNHLVDIQRELVRHQAGIRKLPGTELKNLQTGETVYVPPQDQDSLIRLLTNLEQYINDDSLSGADLLVKMAVVHYQFESIHPFYDGNGRTGRILNILYLVLKGLLDIPILYLSRYIIRTKADYYRLLQKVRDEQVWEEWVLYMLEGVESTSKQTISMVKAIGLAMMDYKHRIRASHKFYSQDLINNLFFHPYARIEFLQRDLRITRVTATKYLDILAQEGFLNKQKYRGASFYMNNSLVSILSGHGEKD